MILDDSSNPAAEYDKYLINWPGTWDPVTYDLPRSNHLIIKLKHLKIRFFFSSFLLHYHLF